MNERIKELSVKAGFPERSNHAIEFELEQFAELIVQDCINNVKSWEKDSRNHISYMLKNHYGVE